MNASTRSTGRTIWVSIRALLLFTVILGIGYTFLITGIGQLILPAQANGSLVKDAAGTVVGSSLIGQSFTDAQGNPLPQYFQSRPSAAGNGYGAKLNPGDPIGASGGSNYGPNSDALVKAITERKAQIAQFNGVSENQVPADAVTASGSGLDPNISPAYAAIQAQRVATARGLSVQDVQALIAQNTQSPDLGYLGESRVNVLALNMALDRLKG